MERCNAKSQTPERRTKPEGTVLWGQARQDEQTEEQQEDIDIVWDPEGPLAPEEGQRPYSNGCINSISKTRFNAIEGMSNHRRAIEAIEAIAAIGLHSIGQNTGLL